MNEIYIKIDDLKDGFLYFILARNSYFGIWKAENKLFLISRFKFNLNYLCEEYHWDTGEPFGTVKPYKELELPPFSGFDENREETLAYLNNIPKKFSSESMSKEYDFRIYSKSPNNPEFEVPSKFKLI